MIIPNTINIDWFGNRPQYEKSELKIITVGLNPSGIEFGVNNDKDIPDIDLRFPHCKSKLVTLCPYIKYNAWNHYFDNNPYWKWFNNFEQVLLGLKASYKYGQKYRAIHTDLCTPWATNPTWSNLEQTEKIALTNHFKFDEWKKLVKELKPDIIIASIPVEYLCEHLCIQLQKMCEIKDKSNGEPRTQPLSIFVGTYNDSYIFLGRTCNVPFGSISDEQKLQVGKAIMAYYKKAKRQC